MGIWFVAGCTFQRWPQPYLSTYVFFLQSDLDLLPSKTWSLCLSLWIWVGLCSASANRLQWKWFLKSLHKICLGYLLPCSFGMLALGTQPPCCGKVQGTAERGFIHVFLANSPRGIPANSWHQQPDARVKKPLNESRPSPLSHSLQASQQKPH